MHRQLGEVQARLARGRTRKAREKVEAEIAAILAPRWMSRVVATTLTGDMLAELRLSFSTDDKARAALETELFGKRILFSDKTPEQASTAQIVADDRSQEAVEGDFRQMKDPKVVSFSPMFHFTEHKIRVHAVHRVLGLMVAKLMVREAGKAGLHLSVRALLSSLSGIEETWCSSTRASGDGPVPGACSPSKTPPSAASTTSSASRTTHQNAELGTTRTRVKQGP